LKQLGLGFTQYVQDYDETWPCGTNGVGMGWGSQIYPYVKSVNVFTCPDDAGTGFSPAIPGYTELSYCLNINVTGCYGAIVNGAYPPYQYQGPKATQDNAPSSTVLLYEITGGILSTNPTLDISPVGMGQWYGTVASNSWQGLIGPGNPTTGLFDEMSPSVLAAEDTARHSGGANWLAEDGHAKYLAATKVSQGFDFLLPNEIGNQNGPAAAATEEMVNDLGHQMTLTFARR
jgi:hypothetical protein